MPHARLISCLATGTEIIEGQIPDGNGVYFSRTLAELGGTIYQHVHTSDIKDEIADALRYLLTHSDAVIITGGLGPTSDDNTRFALAEVTDTELVFNEASWEAILTRFKKYNFVATESNKKQAMMPKGCTVFPNRHGTADACHLVFEGKHLFMLPGPPKESVPLFTEQVLPILEAQQFFVIQHKARWLTLGLIEGAISEKIDALVKPHGFETGYRWVYPYLEIKINGPLDLKDHAVLADLDFLLAPHTVSRNGLDAFECLQAALKDVDAVSVLDHILDGIVIEDARLHYVRALDGHGLLLQASENVSLIKDRIGSITFSCEGYVDHRLVYSHHMTVPYRDADIIRFAKAYAAWQLCVYLSVLI